MLDISITLRLNLLENLKGIEMGRIVASMLAITGAIIFLLAIVLLPFSTSEIEVFGMIALLFSGIVTIAIGLYLFDLSDKLAIISDRQERLVTSNAFLKIIAYNITFKPDELDHAIEHNPSLFTDAELERLKDALKNVST